MLTNDLHSVWHDARGGPQRYARQGCGGLPLSPDRRAGPASTRPTEARQAGRSSTQEGVLDQPRPPRTAPFLPETLHTGTRPRREPRHPLAGPARATTSTRASPTKFRRSAHTLTPAGHARSRTNKPRSTPPRNQPETRATGEHTRVEPSKPLHDTTTRTTSRITKTSNTGSKAGLDRGLKAPEARKQTAMSGEISGAPARAGRQLHNSKPSNEDPKTTSPTHHVNPHHPTKRPETQAIHQSLPPSTAAVARHVIRQPCGPARATASSRPTPGPPRRPSPDRQAHHASEEQQTLDN